MKKQESPGFSRGEQVKGPDWQQHERDIQILLGLDSTISSGNKAHDPSDGVDRRHHTESRFPLMVDAKSTTKKSYSLKRQTLKDWEEKAAAFGNIFAMPLRFEDAEPNALGKRGHDDYIIINIHDFTTLLEAYRDA